MAGVIERVRGKVHFKCGRCEYEYTSLPIGPDPESGGAFIRVSGPDEPYCAVARKELWDHWGTVLNATVETNPDYFIELGRLVHRMMGPSGGHAWRIVE